MLIRKGLSLLLAACVLIPGAKTAVRAEDSSWFSDEEKTRNTAILLNDLNVLSERIISSENGRLVLEEFCDFVIENTNPGALDSKVSEMLGQLSGSLADYRFIEEKRDVLKQFKDQNQARSMLEAIDDPAGIITPVSTLELKDIADSGFTGNTYDFSGIANADVRRYLEDDMQLDKEDTEAVKGILKEITQPLAEMLEGTDVQAYILSDEAVSKLADAMNSKDASSVVSFLRENQDTYKDYGGYWLLKAKSCYEAQDYSGCLEAAEKYEKKRGSFLNRDEGFLNVIPFAIVSAQNTMTSSTRFSDLAVHELNIMIPQLTEDDWALRYFAAQAYMYVSRKTIANPEMKQKYLDMAYPLILTSAEKLAEKQKNDNAAYLSPAAVREISKDASLKEKAELKEFNAFLEDMRRTALPPVSQPLMLNCDLLIGLCDYLDGGEQERKNLNDLLYENGNPLFLNEPLDMKYRMDKESEIGSKEVSFDRKNIMVPADLIAEDFKVTAEIDDGENKTVFDPWTVSLVNREKEDDVSTFTAILANEDIKKFRYKENMVITITLEPSVSLKEFSPMTVRFRTVKKTVFWFFNTIEVEYAG